MRRRRGRRAISRRLPPRGNDAEQGHAFDDEPIRAACRRDEMMCRKRVRRY